MTNHVRALLPLAAEQRAMDRIVLVTQRDIRIQVTDRVERDLDRLLAQIDQAVLEQYWAEGFFDNYSAVVMLHRTVV